MPPLPFVDEHRRLIAAPAPAAWHGLVRVVTRALDRSVGPIGGPWGLQPAGPGGPRPLDVGSTGPGFVVAAIDAERRLCLDGRHRFSRYRLVFELDAVGTGTRLRALTFATFDGPHGRVYRALVVGTRGHVLVVRRLLAAVDTAARR